MATIRLQRALERKKAAPEATKEETNGQTRRKSPEHETHIKTARSSNNQLASSRDSGTR